MFFPRKVKVMHFVTKDVSRKCLIEVIRLTIKEDKFNFLLQYTHLKQRKKELFLNILVNVFVLYNTKKNAGDMRYLIKFFCVQKTNRPLLWYINKLQEHACLF